MSESSIKIFIGTDAVGKRIKAAIKKVAEEKYFGSMSRMFVLDFCEKYGYDRKTGRPKGQQNNGPLAAGHSQ